MKNVACNYSNAQVKVREATSNDPWGPSTVMMSEIADLTYNPAAFNDIMMMLFKRLNDHGKNWRHVYKSLILLDYIIKCGSERIAQQCRENIYTIETLKDFQHIEDNRDQGLNVREKAKQMVILLKDEEKLKSERQKFRATRRRFVQSGVGRNDNSLNGRVSELEDARPSSIGEEEMQLQIALALSKEEMQKDEDIRKGYQARLQHALEESKKNSSDFKGDYVEKPNNVNDDKKNDQIKTTPHVIDDLLSLDFGTSPLNEPNTTTSIQPINNDPWAPIEDNTFKMNTLNADPWNAPSSIQPTPLLSANISQFVNESNVNTLNQNVNDQKLGNNSILNKNEQDKIMIKAESFLGPNSNLVNLDNLMGCSSSSTTTKTSNPFLPSSQQPSNPFLAQQGTPLTLNELIQVQQRSQEKPITMNTQNITNTFPLL